MAYIPGVMQIQVNITKACLFSLAGDLRGMAPIPDVTTTQGDIGN